MARWFWAAAPYLVLGACAAFLAASWMLTSRSHPRSSLAVEDPPNEFVSPVEADLSVFAAEAPIHHLTVHELAQAKWQALPIVLFGEQLSIKESLGRIKPAWSPTSSEAAERTDPARVRLVNRLTSDFTPILFAYANNRPHQFMEHMRGLGETLKHEYVREYKKAHPDLTEGADLFVEYWEREETDPHWYALVPECSSIYLWEGRTAQPLGPGRIAWSILRTVRTYHHQFLPPAGPEQELEHRRTFWFADVSLLVQHDEHLNYYTAPYFFRLWYNSTTGRWHPFQLTSYHEDTVDPLIRIIY